MKLVFISIDSKTFDINHIRVKHSLSKSIHPFESFTATLICGGIVDKITQAQTINIYFDLDQTSRYFRQFQHTYL